MPADAPRKGLRLPGLGQRRPAPEGSAHPADVSKKTPERRRNRSAIPPLKNRSGQARRGDVRRAILVLLAESPLNGYEIITALSERSEGLWRPSPGAVYPALSQLQDEGLITESTAHGRRGFGLTPAGQQASSGMTGPWVSNPHATPASDDVAAAYGALGVAIRAFPDAGAHAHAAEIVTILENARRQVYAVLSEPPTGVPSR